MRFILAVLLLTVAVLGSFSTTDSQDTGEKKHSFVESLRKLQRKPPAQERDSQDEGEKVHAFVESLQMLQREPPVTKSQKRAIIKEATIEQKLDNFNETDERTWRMRYLVNDEYFDEGGPMFIFVGGEWEISSGNIEYGHFCDMAREHNGILFYTEHRFYGESKPTSDLTLDSLQYLHVKQALADLAHFIRYQRESYMYANSKVILAGGSYSATMVVWFEQLYPELIDGGWASSAPLQAKVDFREYKEVVGKAIETLGSRKCYDRIQNGIAQLESMLLNEKRGAEVKAMLKICNNFNDRNDLDVWSLFGTISNIFASIVQSQNGNDIDELCQIIMYYEDDLSAITNLVLLAFGNPSGCIDMSYKDTLEYYLDSTYDNGAGRPWFYQTCNEYGWYQTSASSEQPFGTKFPVTLYTTLCEEIFGEQYTNSFMTAKAAETNGYFGGLAATVENVYMTHGSLDPWSPMGSTSSTFLPNASHCTDLGSISSSDSDEKRASKERIAELVRQWLA